ncbi:hypothetical protein V8F20_005892 [Naviculisporaceae sp. PSN 640]
MPANPNLFFSTYTQLPATIERINDTLIERLGRANRSDDRPNVNGRRALWRHIFSDGWDTSCPNIPPPTQPSSSPPEGYAVHIGKFINDLPPVPIRPDLRIVTGYWGPEGPGARPLPDRRKAGAAAYLRASLNPATTLGISFEIVDSCGDLAYPQGDPTTTPLSSLSQVYYNVALEEHFSNIREARASAMARLDSATIYRVTNYNLQWIIYWGRNRLLKSMEILRQTHRSRWNEIKWETNSGQSSKPRVTAYLSGFRNGHVAVVKASEEDYDMLRTITTCSDVIRELTTIENLQGRFSMEMRTVLSNSGI